MSLDDFMSSRESRLHSPSSLSEWVPKDFPDDAFFLDGSFDPPLSLTGTLPQTAFSNAKKKLSFS